MWLMKSSKFSGVSPSIKYDFCLFRDIFGLKRKNIKRIALSVGFFTPSVFNAKTLDYRFDNQAFVGFMPPQ
jgi:hypothetical protein